MEVKLWEAARDGNEAEVRRILKENPLLNVNWGIGDGWTALHHSCCNGHDHIVSLLLAHPGIDVNQKNNYGWTPFLYACRNGNTPCARLLLKDVRVNPNESNNSGSTPLWYAAGIGHLDVIKWWIASGREMDLGESGDENDAIGVAKVTEKAEVVALLERFKEKPEKTRHEIREELGFFEEMAADVFALVVFLCDDILEIKENEESNQVRFFRIAKELPMELQMILCHRVVGSMGMGIALESREVAFRQLAKNI